MTKNFSSTLNSNEGELFELHCSFTANVAFALRARYPIANIIRITVLLGKLQDPSAKSDENFIAPTDCYI
jgi:hypothetical protein